MTRDVAPGLKKSTTGPGPPIAVNRNCGTPPRTHRRAAGEEGPPRRIARDEIPPPPAPRSAHRPHLGNQPVVWEEEGGGGHHRRWSWCPWEVLWWTGGKKGQMNSSTGHGHGPQALSTASKSSILTTPSCVTSCAPDAGAVRPQALSTAARSARSTTP